MTRAASISSLTFGKDTYLIVSKPEDFHENSIALLKRLVKQQGNNGIYVTLNAPVFNLIASLKEGDVDCSKLHFIDAVSSQIGLKNDNSQAVFIDSPQALTQLSLAISESTCCGQYNFLVFDSLTTLLVYNQPKLAEEFTHYIFMKMKAFGLCGIILSLSDEESKKVIPIIAQFCDRLVTL